MRFLHSADLHLDSPLRSQALRNPDLAERLRGASRQALGRLVDAAIAQEVDALLLAGDIFDAGVADVASRSALAAQLGRLARSGIPTVLIRGNHDALLDHARYGPIADAVTILEAEAPTVRIGAAAIHGIGHSRRHTAESLLPHYPGPEAGMINVGLMHTSLDGSAGHDNYAPCRAGELLAHGYDYWALGHIHRRLERREGNALAVMPGIPQGRHAREPGLGSATLVEIGSGRAPEVQEIPIALLRFETVAVDLRMAASMTERIDRMARALEAARDDGCELAARLTLHGAADLAAESGLARRLAEEAAETVAGVHVEAVRFAREAEAPPPGAVAELAGMMAEDAATPGFRDEAEAFLAEWRAALPPEIADALAADALDALIAEGLDAVAQRLAQAARA